MSTFKLLGVQKGRYWVLIFHPTFRLLSVVEVNIYCRGPPFFAVVLLGSTTPLFLLSLSQVKLACPRWQAKRRKDPNNYSKKLWTFSSCIYSFTASKFPLILRPKIWKNKWEKREGGLQSISHDQRWKSSYLRSVCVNAFYHGIAMYFTFSVCFLCCESNNNCQK